MYEFDELQRFNKKNKDNKKRRQFRAILPNRIVQKVAGLRKTPVPSSIKNLARKRRRNPEISRIEFLGSTGEESPLVTSPIAQTGRRAQTDRNGKTCSMYESNGAARKRLRV